MPIENKAYRLRLINGDIYTGISLGKGIDALREMVVSKKLL
jgi:hypothetical protein